MGPSFCSTIELSARKLDLIHYEQVALCMDYFLLEAKNLINLDKGPSRLAASWAASSFMRQRHPKKHGQ